MTTVDDYACVPSRPCSITQEPFGLMNRKQLLSIGSLLGLLLSSLSAVETASAQAIGGQRSAEIWAAQLGFMPPPDNRAPRTTQGGATRGSCTGTALTLETGGGLTTADQLPLHLYLPTSTDSQSVVEQVLLILTKTDGTEHYEAKVQLPAHEGVVQLPLPTTLPPLELNEEYNWSAILLCDGQLKPDSPVLTGSVKRVAPLMMTEDVDASEQATMYAEAGLWYDWISALAQLRTDNPQDARLLELGQHLTNLP